MRGPGISMIFQDALSSLNPVYSVGFQIGEMFRAHRGTSRKEAKQQAIELMDRVRIPAAAQRVNDYPHQFSGGMRQRVMIAMAIALDPKILIADEPTTALDVTVQAQVMDLLKDLQRETGMGLILITHDLGVVNEVADSVAVMYAGRIVETRHRGRRLRQPGPPLHRRPDELRAPGRGQGRPAPADRGPAAEPGQDPVGLPLPPAVLASPHRAPRRSRAATAPPTCRRCGSSLPAARRPATTARRSSVSEPTGADGCVGACPAPDAGEPLLEVRGLKKHFPLTQGIVFKRTIGYVRAVDGVDLRLGRGETLGLVGESGCGKSTVSKLLVALEKPTAGQILYKGRDVAKMGGRELKQYRREVQIIFQDPYASLNPRMTAGDIVAEGWSVHPDVAPRKGRLKRTQELLDRVGLNPDFVNRYPHQFSGGQRQRIGIARALALQPEIIVCDEPVSALDVSVQAQVVNLLEDLQDDFGLSYLFIAHDLSVVRHISDRVAVMYLGSVVEEGTDLDVYGPPSHPYTQALLSSVPLHRAAPARARRSASCSPATCRARPTRRRAAGSARAAGRPRTSARPRRPPWSTGGRGTRPRATSPRRGAVVPIDVGRTGSTAARPTGRPGRPAPSAPTGGHLWGASCSDAWPTTSS